MLDVLVVFTLPITKAFELLPVRGHLTSKLAMRDVSQ